MSYNPIDEATVTNQKVGFEIDTMGIYAIAPKQGRLPSGFQEVEYLQSSGVQRLDTNVLSTANIGIEIDFQYLTTYSSGWRDLVGSYKPYSSPRSFHMLCNHGGKFLSIVGTSTIALATANTVRHSVVINNSSHQVIFDNTVVGTHDVSTYVDNNCNLGLFAPYSTETPASDFYVSAKLYSAKINDDSNIVRNFVPCYCTESKTGYKGTTAITVDANTPGLYDLVNDRFYINCGSGADFTVGPDVN